MAKWSDADKWRLVRAADLYERQWSLIRSIEFPGKSRRAVESAYQSCMLWERPDDTEYVPLRGESEPDLVAAEVADLVAGSGRRVRVPAAFAGQQSTSDPDEPGDPRDDAEAVDEGLRDYSLVAGNFIFSVDDKVLAIPFAKWDAICRDYSREGTDMTAAEVARAHGIPRTVLTRVLRLYGQFKTSPPFCRERITDSKDDFGPLIREAIENDEHRFLRQLEEARDTEWRRDYERLKKERLSEDRLVAGAAVLLANRPPMPPVEKFFAQPDTRKPQDAHLPTTDEHVGKYNWRRETFGANLTTDISCARLRQHADTSAEWIAQGPPCDTAYRTLIGDLFHALTGETEHGTKLDQDTRGAYVWVSALEAMEYSIQVLTQVARRVVVKAALGNHDGFALFQFITTLHRSFRGRADVEVDITPLKYNYFRANRALHVLDHSYGIGALGWKAKAQMDTVARDTAQEDFHGADRIFYWLGDKHELAVASHGAHQLIRLPSLGEPDEYETSLRYSSRPVAYGFRLDERGFPEASNVVWSRPDEEASLRAA